MHWPKPENKSRAEMHGPPYPALSLYISFGRGDFFLELDSADSASSEQFFRLLVSTV